MPLKLNIFTGNFDEVRDISELVTGPASSTNNAVARFDGSTGKLIQNSSVTISDAGDVIIAGDLTVNGTTTTINTETLDVEDKNISINVSGNDASAEDAGLTIIRTGTNGSFIYENGLTSKFKLGLLGSEIEIADISSSQTLTNKTIDADNNTISDIANANISASAAIVQTKLAALTASRVTVTSASGFIEASTITTTELGYVSGTTSAIQTQLDAKLDDYSSSTDNALMRSNGTAGDAVQDSGILIDDSDNISAIQSITLNSGISVSSILDEDTLTSNSAVALASQQSIKAYIDNNDFNIQSSSGTFTALENKTHLVDTSGGVATITLPSPSVNKYVKIKDSLGNSNTNNITVNPNAAETIDGAASVVIQSDFEAKTFVSDGTNWFCF